MKIFKCEAEDDVVYIRAKTKADAQSRLWEVIGPIPENILTWTEVPKLPKGEQFL